MLANIKSISKETIIYGLGGVAGSLISLLLLPFYTQFLSPEDYGFLSVFTVFQSVIEISASFGLGSGLFRYYLMAKEDAEKEQALSTCFWIQTIFIIGLGLILVLFSERVSFLLFDTAVHAKMIIIVSLSGLLSALGSLIFSVMRADRRSTAYSIVQILKVILLAGLNIYMVAFLDMNYEGVVQGNFIAIAITTLLVMAWFLKRVKFTFSLEFSKRLLAFTAPIFLVNIFFFLLNLSDRFFLNNFLSEADVGIYSLGNKLGSIVMIGIISPFSIAIVPYALSIAREENFKTVFSKIMKYFVIVLVVCSLAIFYFSNEIVHLISRPAYYNAAGIIGPVLISCIFYGLYYCLSIALDIIEKTYLATVVVISGAVISIVSNIFLIPYLGMYGSALAGCLANGTLFLLMFYFCQKNFRINYEIGSFGKLMLLVFIYALIYYAVEFRFGLLLLISIKSLVLLSFPFVIYIFGILDEKERSFVRTLAGKVFGSKKQ